MLDSGYSDLEMKKAYLRLFNYSANKRFMRLDNDFNKSDQIGKAALQINKEIDNTHRINIFQIEEIDQIREYETYLDEHLANYLYKFGKYNLNFDDEIELIEKSELISTRDLSTFKINIVRNFTDYLSSKNLPFLDSTILKSSACAVYRGNDDIHHYLITSKSKDIGNVKLILLHAFNEKQRDPDGLWINFVFGLEDGTYGNLIHDPTRIFLQVIDKHAVEFDYGNYTKKFILNYPLKSQPINLNFLTDTVNSNVTELIFSIDVYRSYFASAYNFIYAIDKREYLRNKLSL